MSSFDAPHKQSPLRRLKDEIALGTTGLYS